MHGCRKLSRVDAQGQARAAGPARTAVCVEAVHGVDTPVDHIRVLDSLDSMLEMSVAVVSRATCRRAVLKQPPSDFHTEKVVHPPSGAASAREEHTALDIDLAVPPAVPPELAVVARNATTLHCVPAAPSFPPQHAKAIDKDHHMVHRSKFFVVSHSRRNHAPRSPEAASGEDPLADQASRAARRFAMILRDCSLLAGYPEVVVSSCDGVS